MAVLPTIASVLDTSVLHRMIAEFVHCHGPKVVGTVRGTPDLAWRYEITKLEYFRESIHDCVESLAKCVCAYRNSRGGSVREYTRPETSSPFAFASLPVETWEDPANGNWLVQVRDMVEPASLTEFVGLLDSRLQNHLRLGIDDIKLLADDCRFALGHTWDRPSYATEYRNRLPPYGHCLDRLRQISATVFLLESAQARRGA